MTIARALFAVLAALAVTACRTGAHVEPFDPFGAAGVDGKPGAQIPLDGAFRDTSGRSVTLRGLAHGRPLVIAPVQHRCPNLCGLTLSGLHDAIAGQSYRPGRDFEVVALGIDPREDSEAARISEQRLADPAPVAGVAALVGPAAEIARVTHALGYRFAWDPRIGQYAHIAAVAVVTPDGRLARWLYGVAPAPGDLHRAVADAGRGRLGGLGERLRLLCYHFDPKTGRWSGLVMDLVRAIGLATVAALLGLVAWLSRRGRARRRPG